ncbi:MAG: hypothetical protein JW768_06360 [Chitinispirillaceae bacterium]|nr:hypothetical protein [Chitinispirillaceae bacterium]
MNLAPGITAVPIVHGKQVFAGHVRNLCISNRFDCIALDLPEPLQGDLGPAVENLPVIQAIVAQGFSDATAYYLPIDPCDAAIEGVRQALQNRIPFFCIGSGRLTAPVPMPPLPDEHAIASIGFDRYCGLCLTSLGNPAKGSADDENGRLLAARIRELGRTYRNILALVHFRRFVRTVYHFGMDQALEQAPASPSWRISTHYVNPDHLYFALGELPFVTGKFEKERHDPFAPPIDVLDEIKNLFRETRDNYYDDADKTAELSPVRIQAALTFLRNLTVQSGWLIPSLFDIVEAAKGVGGNGYALRTLKNARYYPYLPFEAGTPLLGIGLDRITLPPENETVEAVNLLRDTEVQWRTVTIKPDPSLERKKKYRYAWNPLGMCSHVPEDAAIERFNAHVRNKTLRMLLEEFARHEKFTSSVKDGIDIRETLRNWHTGSIYVRELPPSRGNLDTVVIIFDDSHDDRYPHHTTWYAEHGEESTLTFYGTDPFADLIGPGIARCTYGGLSLLFPPRPIPNIFTLTRSMDLPNLAAQITYGGLLFSQEPAVAYVSSRKPGVFLRTMAGRMKKRLVWVPLASFSNETLRRLRKFHILNGKEVRSWATRFIGD